jgi:hypothetical protein
MTNATKTTRLAVIAGKNLPNSSRREVWSIHCCGRWCHNRRRSERTRSGGGNSTVLTRNLRRRTKYSVKLKDSLGHANKSAIVLVIADSCNTTGKIGAKGIKSRDRR